MNYVDIAPTADFDYAKFMVHVRLYGFQNELCCIPADSIQCTMYNEREVLDAMNKPPVVFNTPPENFLFPPRPN